MAFAFIDRADLTLILISISTDLRLQTGIENAVKMSRKSGFIKMQPEIRRKTEFDCASPSLHFQQFGCSPSTLQHFQSQ